jgi:hypothetical protein
MMRKRGDDNFEECLHAMKDLYKNNADLYDAANATFLSSMGQDGWVNTTMTETGLSQLYDECQAVGGRFAVVDTAAVKCNYPDRPDLVMKNAFTNVGDCFPNIPACDSYTVVSYFTNESTTSSWCGEIESSCHVISDVPRTTYVPEVLLTTTSTTKNSRFGPPAAAANRTGKGQTPPPPPPPPSLYTTTTATNGGGLAVGAAVLLLAVFLVGTIIHRRRQHKWTRTHTRDIDDNICRHRPLVRPWPYPEYRDDNAS